MRFGLRGRLIALELVTITGLLAALGLFLGAGADEWAGEVLDRELEQRALEIEGRLEVKRSGEIELDDDDEPEIRAVTFRLWDRRGTVLAAAGTELSFSAIAAEGGEPRYSSIAIAGRRLRVLSRTAHAEHTSRLDPARLPLILAVAAPAEPFAALSSRFRTGLLVALVLGALLGVAGALLTAQIFLAPIRRLSRDVAAIDPSSLERRLDVAGLDPELGRLARGFNDLLGRLEGAFERQRSFVSRASHALRTPLATMLSSAEVTLRRERSAEEYRSALEQIAEAARGSASLVEGLLALSRADASGATLRREAVELESVADRMRRLIEPRTLEAGLSLEWDVAPGLRVDADRERFEELIAALLDNAIRYTPPGGKIGLSARPREGSDRRVEVEVWDTGYGLAPGEHERVFERFFRGSAAERSGAPGTGLGLAVVAAIASAHGAGVEIEARREGGTRVRLDWPRAAYAARGAVE